MILGYLGLSTFRCFDVSIFRRFDFSTSHLFHYSFLFQVDICNRIPSTSTQSWIGTNATHHN
jgi:hypothetical protein